MGNEKEWSSLPWDKEGSFEDRDLDGFRYLKAQVVCFSFTILDKVKVTQSCPTLCDLMDYTVHGIFQAGILEWVAFLFSRGSSQPRNGTQVFPVLQVDSLPAEPKGSPRIQEWAAYPFSSRSSRPRNRTGVSCIAGGFFTN